MQGAVTSYIDVAQLALYGFWLFFAGLVYYLRREDKREGYPLQSDVAGNSGGQGFPFLPAPKTFILPHGGIKLAPEPETPSGNGNAAPSGPWPGAPLVPLGDPMLDGVGPAAYAMRKDTPDLTWHGDNRLAPLRVDPLHYLEPDETDPRGMAVLGYDRVIAGIVTDLWVDRSELVLRYLEVEVPTTAGPRRVLLPMALAKVNARAQTITAASVKAHHFATAPTTRDPDAVTSREEDRICAYFGSGHMYAEPSRAEPLL